MSSSFEGRGFISLKKVAENFSASAKTGVDAAQKSCPGDTRIVWLGIQGTWAGTSFDKSVESYLLDLGVDKSKLHSRDVGSISGAGAKEDADRAIIDLATHFDWRDGAARAILYIGDESLEGGGETGINDPAQRKAVDSAIATCNTFDVPVYTYFAADPNKKATKAEVKTLYTAISENTGALYSEPFVSPSATLRGRPSNVVFTLLLYTSYYEFHPAINSRGYLSPALF